jgi:UDP-N-acetylmuramyl tripeptide synthase
MAAWIDDGALCITGRDAPLTFGRAADLRFALNGAAAFQLHNALTAGALASAMGIAPESIQRGLERFNSTDVWMPDSFQVIDLDGIAIVVDRPNPSWFLRPVLRSLRDIAPNRIISVVGRLAGIPTSDLAEVGRLIGRNSSLVVSHSEDDEPARAAAIKQGAAQNEVPAVIVHTRSEGRALSRALSLAKRGDVVLVLADRPALLARALMRIGRATHASYSASTAY